MSGARLAEIPPPESIPTKFHVWANDRILLTNFDVGKSDVKPEHERFIAGVYMPWLIKQVDALADPNFKTLTYHVFGFASATGKSARNQALSEARAASVGALLRRAFDAAKTKSAFARALTLQFDIKGEGDRAAREALNSALKAANLRREQVADATVETLQYGSRAAMFSTVIRPNRGEEYLTYHARQVYVLKMKKKKVPANRLEAEIEEIEREWNAVVPKEVTALIGLTFDLIKQGVKEAVKEVLSDVPLLFLIEDLLEFLWVSDIGLCFQFRDHRGQIATYDYFGSENKQSYGLLKVFSRLVSLLKTIAMFSTKVEAWLKAAKRFDKLSKMAKNLENMRKIATKVLENMTGKDSAVRKLLGDELVDLVVQSALGAGPGTDDATAPVSEWSPFRFRDPKFYDVRTFGGFARTLLVEKLYKSELTLDFAAENASSSLNYKATVVITSGISARSNLLGIGVSHGMMTVRPG